MLDLVVHHGWIEGTPVLGPDLLLTASRENQTNVDGRIGGAEVTLESSELGEEGTANAAQADDGDKDAAWL